MNDQLNSSNFQSPLPNATAVLVLGILSIIGCFCYGLPGLIMAVIALVLANKDNKLYSANPSNFTAGSLSNLKAGKICAIIGIIMSSIYLLIFIVIIATIGFEALTSGDPQTILDQLENMK